ncbi:MAG: hypothetical protein K6G49_02160 [Candidatus Saccharibacteria bacterium]|nr:hypothetical protein [Candidatus Saccharibacteria bacterium]
MRVRDNNADWGSIMKESVIQQQVADYLKLQYPKVIFHSDFGSGIKLTMGQAVKQKRLNGGRRAWPDMFVAEPQPHGRDWYHGLFIELKKEGTRLKKKNGEWSSEHIAEQAAMLSDLQHRGYMADFALGFDQAKRLIDDYLKEVKHEGQHKGHEE